MTYSPAPFVHGLEAGIAGVARSFFSSMRSEAERDQSGPRAVSKLISALRRERRGHAATATRLAETEAELLAVREQLAGARLLLRLHDVG